MIDKKLPTVDTVAGYEGLQSDVRHDARRRRGWVVAAAAAAAAAVVVATAGAVLVNRTGHEDVVPAKSPEVATFQSPLYGYSIDVPAVWRTSPASQYADDPTSTDKTATDSFHVPGTDTTIGVTASYLGQETYADWAKAYHRNLLADKGVPSSCDGGDPSAWRRLQIGSVEGYLLQRCNAAIGIAPVGKRVYLFSWGNRTFVEGHHYPQSRFEPLLAGVQLPRPAVARRPLWQPSGRQG